MRLPMKLKLLVLTSTFPRWKKDVEPPFVFELCRRLKDAFDIHVLAPHAPGAGRKEILDGIFVTRFRYCPSRWELLSYGGGILANLKHHPIRFGLIPFFLFGQWIGLIKLLRKRQFDCIHAHWLLPQGILACAASLFVKTPPILCTSHGGDLFGLKGRLFNRIKRCVGMHSSAVTVVSRSMARYLGELGVDSRRIQVIPMGVDLHHLFTPPTNKKTECSLLFVGRLVEKKGVRYLVEAMPAILHNHPQAILRIVGSGQDQSELKLLAESLGVGSRIHFLGSIDNHLLPPLYRDSEIVVFPSIVASDGDQEGFGLVLVEALGCECAAVITDLAAMQDIVEHGKTAWVVPQKNSSAIAEAVSHLFDDAGYRRSLGREGRERVLKDFDWMRIADRYRRRIEALIRSHGNRSS